LTTWTPPLPSFLTRPPAPETSLASRAGLVAFPLLAVLLLGVGDAVTGSDVSFTLLYLLPIAFGTWFVGPRYGIALSVLASLSSAAADVAARAGEPLTTAVLVWNLLVQLGVFLAVAVLLAGFRRHLETEQQLARTDALTQVSNRRAFIEAAELELERARRTDRPLTLAYVDCDDFKQVNDRLGHAAGDRLLAVVAQTLRGSTRAVDAVARLGGDEFGLLLPETDSPTAEALLGRLRATLAAAMTLHGWKLGFSMGAATFVRPPASVDTLLAKADELMYRAKRGGKGAVCTAEFGAALARPARISRVEPPSASASAEG
jgi:diguanylate cyclase (GGDEF)-like protein